MGISQAYDTGTKIASIYKEFYKHNRLGFILCPVHQVKQHLQQTLDIELNLMNSLFHPGFSYTTHNNPNARDYRDIVWGLDARFHTDLQATETPGGTTDGITVP